MLVIPKKNPYLSFDCMRRSGEINGRKSMHPDDLKAHLAWITAKRFYEIGTKNVSG